MDTLSFADFLQNQQVNLNSVNNITLINIFSNMLISTILGIFIALVYRYAFIGVLYQKTYAFVLILITMVTTMVIMVIGGNLVLSLGMVGALSIVRFRSAIKDPLDIVYIFWAIGVGIANGVSFYKVSLTASIFIALVLFLIRKFPSKPEPKLIVINADKNEIKKVIDIIFDLDKKCIIRSESLDGQNVEIVFETHNKNINLEKINLSFKSLKSPEIRLLNYSGNN